MNNKTIKIDEDKESEIFGLIILGICFPPALPICIIGALMMHFGKGGQSNVKDHN